MHQSGRAMLTWQWTNDTIVIATFSLGRFAYSSEQSTIVQLIADEVMLATVPITPVSCRMLGNLLLHPCKNDTFARHGRTRGNKPVFLNFLEHE